MSFNLIDYSKVYFKSVLKTPVPARRDGKFIQVRNNNHEYLLLSPVELTAYHANIAERFFSGRGIGGRFNKKMDYYEVGDPEWEIIGGGMWSVDEGKKTLRLSGRSQAYGTYDSRGLAARISASGQFPGYSVET